MKNKIVTHFYVKETRKNSQGVAPIYLRITVNGERSELSTNQKIKAEYWDKASERATGRTESARTINSHLNNLIGKVEKYYSSLDVKDERISVYQIIDELKGKGVQQMTLVQAYEYHLKNLEGLIGIDYALSTVEKYRYSLDSLKDFIKAVYHKSDIRLCDLDYRFIESYHDHMRTTGGLMHNSTVKNIKNLIRIINVSIANKWLQTNPFKTFSCNYDNNNRSYLTEEEVEAIISKELPIKRLDRVRDLFVFQMYTGLSFIDMAGLKASNIEIGIDGNRWLVVERRKTGTRSSIPLLPRAQRMLDKYANDPMCIAENILLPICSNQRMNGYLKEIADLCGISKNLTTHLARHTFATTITLSAGVPIETVSKMLGHTDLKTTQIYSKVVDRKIADDMRHLIAIPLKRNVKNT